MVRMQSMSRTVIGLLGGTFNPIHFGHLRMAQELAQSLSLDEVRFIPAANPPHKVAPSVSATDRAEMVKLGIADNTTFKFDDSELRRSGASYMVDTLQSLRAELSDETSLVLFMGSDAFTEFNRWHHWEEIINLCHIALVERPTAINAAPLPQALKSFLHNHHTNNINDLHHTSAGYVIMQAITALDISSTAIRNQLAAKQSARYLMPDNVIDYIKSHQLYRA
jgi:nicotinate-nucleotide adenylyltransferase